MTKITLRRATLSDCPLLEYWDTKPHVIFATGADEPFDWKPEVARNEPWQEILIAEADGRPIGVVQICDPLNEPSHYWGDIEPDLRAIDVWIGEESDLGRGFGTEMMRLTVEQCFANPAVKAIVIDPLQEFVSMKD